MERCEEIFNRIVEGGEQAIDDFIVDRKIEDLFLDFKRSSDNGEGRRLSNIDRKNLAKAISGFGNSEGGVIVWGVDCSADFDGADVAHTKIFINNPKKFASLLQGVISGCTVPPHPDVENHVLEVDENRGFVITLVRKSTSAPHQMLPDMRYLIRAGSDFVPTPHDVLAGMFGKRPQPHVFQHYILSKPSLKNGGLDITFGIAIHNKGPGIATDVFCTCLMQYLPGQNSTMMYETPDQANWTGYYEFERQISLISSPGFRLPPACNTQPVVVRLLLAPPFDGELKISGSVGSGESKRYEFVIENSADVIENQYQLFLQKAKDDSFEDGEKHKIAEVILGVRDA